MTIDLDISLRTLRAKRTGLLNQVDAIDIFGERFEQLLGRPRPSRMRGAIDVDDSATVV